MRIFIATMGTETNSFSPIPTGMNAFAEYEYWDGDGSCRPPVWGNIPLVEWRRLAESDGHEIVESLCAFAMPAGPVTRVAHETVRDRILADLADARADLVLFNLHGAMVAEGEDDCEGDLLARARAIVGSEVPILAELDLHAHLSHRMVSSADMLVAYKEYPHTDIADRAVDLYHLAIRVQRRDIAPRAGVGETRMLMKMRPTVQPMRGYVDRLYAMERDDNVLSASLLHGFPFGDVADLGARALVYCDGDGDVAQRRAAALARELWDMREAISTHYLDIDAALDVALGQSGPVVIADGADNSGSGAPSDSTFILDRMIARALPSAALAGLWDPVAVGFARDAGVGATIPIRLGGKCGPTSGSPLDVVATVMGESANHRQTGLSGGMQDLGPSVWLRIGSIDVIVITQRQQVLAPDIFTGLGCSVEDKQVIVVKSAQHFNAGFGPIVRATIYAAAPGCAPPDVRLLALTKCGPLWPRIDNPFA